jgi:hypothetical protein
MIINVNLNYFFLLILLFLSCNNATNDATINFLNRLIIIKIIRGLIKK